LGQPIWRRFRLRPWKRVSSGFGVDLGLEKDRDRRFALWAVLYMLGEAPDLDVCLPAGSGPGCGTQPDGLAGGGSAGLKLRQVGEEHACPCGGW
jgi:hypothetical protein